MLQLSFEPEHPSHLDGDRAAESVNSSKWSRLSCSNRRAAGGQAEVGVGAGGGEELGSCRQWQPWQAVVVGGLAPSGWQLPGAGLGWAKGKGCAHTGPAVGSNPNSNTHARFQVVMWLYQG